MICVYTRRCENQAIEQFDVGSLSLNNETDSWTLAHTWFILDTLQVFGRFGWAIWGAFWYFHLKVLFQNSSFLTFASDRFNEKLSLISFWMLYTAQHGGGCTPGKWRDSTTRQIPINGHPLKNALNIDQASPISLQAMLFGLPTINNYSHLSLVHICNACLLKNGRPAIQDAGPTRCVKNHLFLEARTLMMVLYLDNLGLEIAMIDAWLCVRFSASIGCAPH